MVNGYTHVCPKMFTLNRPMDVPKPKPAYEFLAFSLLDTIELLKDMQEDMKLLNITRYDEELTKHIDRLTKLGL
jgi:hypothetical protein